MEFDYVRILRFVNVRQAHQYLTGWRPQVGNIT